MSQEKKKLILSLFVPIVLIVLLWAIKAIEMIWDIDLSFLGILPRNINGLWGILTAPLIHADISHLSANSVSLFALTWLTFYFYREIAPAVFIWTWFLSGLWVWFGAREAYHIGASTLVYGLASFLFLSGFVRRNQRLMAVSLIIVFLYGGLVWGVFPQFWPEKNISWEGHLSGLLAGAILAYRYRKSPPHREIYEWELEDDDGGVEEHISDNDSPPEPEQDMTSEQEGLRYKYHYREPGETSN